MIRRSFRCCATNKYVSDVEAGTFVQIPTWPAMILSSDFEEVSLVLRAFFAEFFRYYRYVYNVYDTIVV